MSLRYIFTRGAQFLAAAVTFPSWQPAGLRIDFTANKYRVLLYRKQGLELRENMALSRSTAEWGVTLKPVLVRERDGRPAGCHVDDGILVTDE
jgi:hypothetical protein